CTLIPSFIARAHFAPLGAMAVTAGIYPAQPKLRKGRWNESARLWVPALGMRNPGYLFTTLHMTSNDKFFIGLAILLATLRISSQQEWSTLLSLNGLAMFLGGLVGLYLIAA